MHEGEEGDGEERELAQGGRFGEGHQTDVARACAPGRDDHLHDGDDYRKDQREMSELDDHGVAVSPAALPSWCVAPWPSLTPFSLSALATSGGM